VATEQVMSKGEWGGEEGATALVATGAQQCFTVILLVSLQFSSPSSSFPVRAPSTPL